MYTNVLIAIDPGHLDRTDAMLNSVQEVVHSGKAHVTLLSVIQELPGYIAAQIPLDLHKAAIDEAYDALNALIQKHELPEATTVSVVTGHPFQTIRKQSEDAKVDLIVVGSHQPGPSDILLGSVASQVVRHVHCSVLVVR